MLGIGAVAAGAVAGGFAASISAAAGFEKAISAIGAVTGLDKQSAELQQLSDLALQLGKDTTFSASEAAAGLGELAKGGVSVADIMGGAAQSALNLAAAGGVSVADAAALAANAMSLFNIQGKDMGQVVDSIAGFANATTGSVNDFKFALSSVGAVANLSGQTFEDTATSISLMGKAGILGSDAGTSLKTMLLNLQPTTNAASEAFAKLGITVADETATMKAMVAVGLDPASKSMGEMTHEMFQLVTGAKDGDKVTNEMGKAWANFGAEMGLTTNRFIDQEGHFKSLRDISEILQEGIENLTDAEAQLALKAAFGQDAVRASAILAHAGAEGFDAMAEAMGKVSAEAVAEQRLNNLAGAMEAAKGSAETAAITFGLSFLPVLTDLTKQGTVLLNEFVIPWAEQHGPALAESATVMVASLAGIVGTVGGVLGAIGEAQDKFGGLSTTMSVMSGVMAAGTALWVAHEAAIIGARVAAFAAIVAQDGLKVAILGTNAALLANPFVLVATAVVALGTALVVLYNTNEDFRNTVNAAWESVSTTVGGAVEAIGSGLNDLVQGAAIAAHGIAETMSGLGIGISNTAFVVADAIGGLGELIGQQLSAVLTTAGGLISGFGQKLGQMSEALGPLGVGLRVQGAALEHFGDGLVTMGQDAEAGFTGMRGAITAFGVNVNEKLQGAAGALNTWSDSVTGAQEDTEGLEEQQTHLLAVMEAATEAGISAADATTLVSDALAAGIDPAIALSQAIADTVDAADSMSGALSELADETAMSFAVQEKGVLGFFDRLAVVAGSGWDILTERGGQAFEDLRTLVRSSLDSIGGSIGSFFDGLGTQVRGGLDELGTGVRGALDATGRAVGDFFDGLGTNVQQGITRLASAIGSTFDQLGTNVRTGLDVVGATIDSFFDGLGTTVRDTLTGMWEGIPEDIRADLELIVSTVRDRFLVMVDNAQSWKTDMLAAVGDTFSQLSSLVQEGLANVGSFFDDLGTVARDAWDVFAEVAGTALEWVGGQIEARIDLYTGLIGGFFDWLGTHAHDAWDAFSSFVGNAFDLIGTAVDQGVRSLTTAIGNFFDWLGTEARSAWTRFSDAVGATWSTISSAVASGISDIMGRIGTFFSDIGTQARTGWDNFSNVVAGALSSVAGAVATWATGLLTELGTVATRAYAEAGWIGGQIIEGLKHGLGTGVNVVKDAAGNVARGALDAAKQALGIPGGSSLAFTRIGLEIDEGYVHGMEQGTPKVEMAARKVARQAIVAATDELGQVAVVVQESVGRIYTIVDAQRWYNGLVPPEDLSDRVAEELGETETEIASANAHLQAAVDARAKAFDDATAKALQASQNIANVTSKVGDDLAKSIGKWDLSKEITRTLDATFEAGTKAIENGSEDNIRTLADQVPKVANLIKQVYPEGLAERELSELYNAWEEVHRTRSPAAIANLQQVIERNRQTLVNSQLPQAARLTMNQMAVVFEDQQYRQRIGASQTKIWDAIINASGEGGVKNNAQLLQVLAQHDQIARQKLNPTQYAGYMAAVMALVERAQSEGGSAWINDLRVLFLEYDKVFGEGVSRARQRADELRNVTSSLGGGGGMAGIVPAAPVTAGVGSGGVVGVNNLNAVSNAGANVAAAVNAWYAQQSVLQQIASFNQRGWEAVGPETAEAVQTALIQIAPQFGTQFGNVVAGILSGAFGEGEILTVLQTIQSYIGQTGQGLDELGPEIVAALTPVVDANGALLQTNIQVGQQVAGLIAGLRGLIASLPRAQHGGVFSTGTLAVIGEGGQTEVVSPVTLMARTFRGVLEETVAGIRSIGGMGPLDWYNTIQRAIRDGNRGLAEHAYGALKEIGTASGALAQVARTIGSMGARVGTPFAPPLVPERTGTPFAPPLLPAEPVPLPHRNGREPGVPRVLPSQPERDTTTLWNALNAAQRALREGNADLAEQQYELLKQMGAASTGLSSLSNAIAALRGRATEPVPLPHRGGTPELPAETRLWQRTMDVIKNAGEQQYDAIVTAIRSLSQGNEEIFNLYYGIAKQGNFALDTISTLIQRMATPPMMFAPPLTTAIAGIPIELPHRSAGPVTEVHNHFDIKFEGSLHSDRSLIDIVHRLDTQYGNRNGTRSR